VATCGVISAVVVVVAAVADSAVSWHFRWPGGLWRPLLGLSEHARGRRAKQGALQQPPSRLLRPNFRIGVNSAKIGRILVRSHRWLSLLWKEGAIRSLVATAGPSVALTETGDREMGIRVERRERTAVFCGEAPRRRILRYRRSRGTMREP
jgi:hypothetical protein